jgi:hypothetical protein
MNEIARVVRKGLSSMDTAKCFENVQDHIRIKSEAPCHNLIEFKRRTTKAKGDVFELFCKMYLLTWRTSMTAVATTTTTTATTTSSPGNDNNNNHDGGSSNKKFAYVWLLADTPINVLTHLGLTQHDVGIDIIAATERCPGGRGGGGGGGAGAGRIAASSSSCSSLPSALLRPESLQYWAIQAKYRVRRFDASSFSCSSSTTGPNQQRRRQPRVVLGWHQLSTFYALCARTGPWQKQCVMTNCDYIRRMGNRQPGLDYTIAAQGFRATSRLHWSAIASLESCDGKTHSGGHSLLLLSDHKCAQEPEKENKQKIAREAWLNRIESKVAANKS